MTQLEILPKPPEGEQRRDPLAAMAEDYAHVFLAGRRLRAPLERPDQGSSRRRRPVRELFGVEVNWLPGAKGWEMKEIPGTEFVLPADLVLIAMGFLHVVRGGLLEELGVKIDNRGNVAVDNWMSSVPGVFAAGDTVRGASLVVHAINQGRIMAAAVDKWLRK